ncbi:hypothetical protein CDL12_10198 [Handroanthus impetiginosus]|uniref:Low-temperature-induced 65 kDa protein n=1 Tax=Handroanthus impetiginosus TaxID=429701 RepID=A0A2G9HIM6_9LAMI|nr:hypothetical protein CDL12_10198 [Handroanthus impetiginosus]
MESQMHRHHHHEDDPHTTGEGEHHGEKKSVLKKVKEKAKKIKDTMKKHGHGHGTHEHEHDYPRTSEEEDEEMVDDPEIHGAPMYESAVITGTNLPVQTGFNLEKPTDKREDQYKPNVKNEVYSSLKVEDVNPPSGPGKMGREFRTYNPDVAVEEVTTRPFGPEKMGPEFGSYNPKIEDIVLSTRPTGPGKMGPESESYPSIEAEGVPTWPPGREKTGPKVGSYYSNAGHGITAGEKTGPEFGNYNPNVEDEGVTTGLTGRVKLQPELGRYNNSTVEDEGKINRPTGPGKMVPELGSYDHNVKTEVNPDVEDREATTMLWGPGKMGMELERPPEEAWEPELNTPHWSSPYTVDVETANVMETSNVEEPTAKIGPLEGIEEDPHAPKNRAGKMPANYQSKVTDPTGEGGEEAEVAPLIERLDNLHAHDELEKPVPEQKSYAGSHDQFAPQPTPTEDHFTPGSNLITPSKSLDSPKVYDVFDPEFMPHDVIAGKISSATSVIADKAVAAKNVVASKLGYGGENEETEDTSKKPESESPKVYDIAASESIPHDTIAEKISSATSVIADKAVATKNVVASKLGYGGGQEQTEDTSKKPVSESATDYAHKFTEKLAPVYGKVEGAGSAMLSKVQGGGGTEEEGRDTVVGEKDKGVPVKEYLAVKLSPGDEDKALSEVITEALHKKKEVMQGAKPVAGAEDDAMRLENKREGEDAVPGRSESPGGGAVDRLKNAVGSWFGKRSEHGEEEVSGQQRRLQESGN